MVRRFGDGDLVACATLQDGLEHLERSWGFWAFRRVGRVDAYLGGPICDPSDRGAMVEQMLHASRRPMVFYVREPMAVMLAEAGLKTAGIGVDRVLDVDALLDAPPKPVRGAQRKADKAGFSVEEARFEEVDRARLRQINRTYLANAEVEREIVFLNRPMSYEDDGMRRVFVLRQGGRELGFAVLNPIFRDGAVTAYLLDLLRLEPTKQWGVWLATVHALARRLRDEGVGLSVGFCPLHDLRHPPGASRALRWQLDRMEAWLSSAQYLRRLHELKATLPGSWESRSMAVCTRFAPRALHTFMEASGVGFDYLFGPDLVRVLARGLTGRG